MYSVTNLLTLDNLNCALLTVAKFDSSHSDLKQSNTEMLQN